MVLKITKEEILAKYVPGDGRKDLSHKLRIGLTSLQKYIKKFDINFTREKRVSIRKYPIDENVFKQDTEAAFYIAGFIAADGAIIMEARDHEMQREPRRLAINEKDYDHLCLIRDILSPTRKLITIICKDSLRNPEWKDSTQYMLNISSETYVADLKRFDIGMRKSLTYQFPEWIITHPLVNHFMRGYFDGDGSVCLPTNSRQKMIHIRGTCEFLQTFNLILSQHCQKVSATKSTNIDSGIGSLQYNGKNICNEIGVFLYNNATLFMKRKHDIFLAAPSYIDHKVRL